MWHYQAAQMMENHASSSLQSVLPKALHAAIVHGQARSFTSINDSTQKTRNPLKHSAPVLEVLGNVPNSPVSAFPSLEKTTHVRTNLEKFSDPQPLYQDRG